jgi:glycosyltransferase involved in cell wall biosynthesis
MACGIPVLAFDTPINREILGDAGVYAHFADAEDFAARLEELISQEGLRRELSEKVRKKAVEEHSWEARGRELEDACREAAAGKR